METDSVRVAARVRILFGAGGWCYGSAAGGDGELQNG